MKKHLLLVVLFVCAGFATPDMCAQSLESASNAYKTFVRLNNENGDKVTMYATLYQCYKDYAAVLNVSTPGSIPYGQAKTALRDIFPYLQKGAVFYSQKNNQKNALLLAQAYVDIPLMKAFKGETFAKDSYYPTLVYFAASGTYNSKDYAKAIPYFREYLETKDTGKRQSVFVFMAKACGYVKDYATAREVLEEAIANYPSDFNMLSTAINCCIDNKDNDGLQKFVNKALVIKPNDPTLLNIQGKLYEERQDFQKALNVYTKLRSSNPRSLEVAKHVGLNYYNLGVISYNKGAMESNPEAKKELDRQSKEYFTAAVSVFKDVLVADPTSLKYMQALATAYNCLGNTKELTTMNGKITSLGGSAVSSSAVPALVDYSGNVLANAAPASSFVASPTASVSSSATAPPTYSEFAKGYVEKKIGAWQAKDPYETVEEYKERVTEATRDAKVKDLLKEAESNYITLYAQSIQLSEMELRPYDADNQVFLVQSKFGEIILPVPRDNNEAKIFASNWNGVQLKDPKFYIDNDRLALSSVTFVTPMGNSYSYNNKEALNYTETAVDVRFDAIDYSSLAQTGTTSSSSSSRIQKNQIKVGSSDVDINIPETKGGNDNCFAVIISNENYSMVSKVPMALNDGETFRRYCEKTLGMPKNNIRFYPDASYGMMLRAMRDIKDIAAAYSGDIQVVFYYAGHGIPNESTRDAFLLPIDADGTQTEGCYSLNKLYTELGGLNAKSVVVFLDACFSGAKRDGGMLASARGVALKVKKEDPKGNMVIFSAASDDETAFPYKDKGHGLFTYFLLKKLQETKGNVTLQELGQYITENVKRESVVVNRKVQTPTVSPSASIVDNWQSLKLKP